MPLIQLSNCATSTVLEDDSRLRVDIYFETLQHLTALL